MRRFAAYITIILILLGLIGTLRVPKAVAGRSDAFKGAGLSGSSDSVIQTEATPAKVARVAAVPGSSEVWGVGDSQSQLPGWLSSRQIVFVKRAGAGSWRLAGPPKDAQGRVINPSLSDFAISAHGEGWAVGGTTSLPDGSSVSGTLLRKAPGSDEWVLSEDSNVSQSTLLSVSLKTVGSKTVGYAVGKGPTILKYDGSRWTNDSIPADIAAEAPGLIGVATVSEEEAWAVTDESAALLRIYHRIGGSWTRVLVDEPLFDGPYPAIGPNGGFNQDANGSAIAATSGVVFIGGKMLPSDALTPIAPDQAEDRSRPFVIKMRYSGPTVHEKTSFCPDQYRLQTNSSISESTALCDKPFPSAPYDIPSIHVISDTEAFAGGLGLFHYKGDKWMREPNSIGYVISVSMVSAHEGWMAPTGNSYSRGQGIRPESSIVGHYTNRPARPSLSRWPQTEKKLLEAVAISPDGSRAVAVGARGAAIAYTKRLGWDINSLPLSENLHAVAWPGSRAWTVGDRGQIWTFENDVWTEHRDSGKVTRRNLFGLAFASPSDAVAVGSSGTILRFDGSRWTPMSSPTDRHLYAVTNTQDGYLAVGDSGTVIEYKNGGWAKRQDAMELLEKFRSPHLYAVGQRADGSIIAGGENSALIFAGRGGEFRPFDPPINGTVISLVAPKSGDRVLVSITPDLHKFDRNSSSVMRGQVMALEHGAWRDIWLQRKVTISANSDSSSFDDPVLGIATLDGSTGWAAGGTPSGVRSEEGHMRSEQTGSIYKIALNTDPSPQYTQSDLRLPNGVNFAVFGESWCGPVDGGSLCGANVGSGTMADLVPLRIRDEINRASLLPNGPKFVLFTGNMRSTGAPEELGEFKSFIEGFRIPVFAAVGDKDLFKGLDPATLAGETGNAVGDQGTNNYWKELFIDSAAPWGRRVDLESKPSYIRPLPDSGNVVAGLARTHYAFDVIDNNRPVLRVLVVDSSTKSLAGNQNPDSPQATWINDLTLNAKINSPPIPVVIAMNQPSVFPDVIQVGNWQPSATQDKIAFEGTVNLNGVTAVFSGGLRMNTTDGVPRGGYVPLFVVGGGGAPLGFEHPQGLSEPTKRPGDGFYHGWHLATVDPDPAKRNLIGQFPIRISSFAALDSLAMHSLDGEQVAAGHTMRFNALARQLVGGWSDWEQAKASYMFLGFNSLQTCGNYGQGGDACLSRTALRPPFRFYSENPQIADFVLPDFTRGGRVPLQHPRTREILLDTAGQFGLLCSFKLGQAGINIESGFFRARMVINIIPGDGPCVKAPVRAPDKPVLIRNEPAQPAPQEIRPQPFRPLIHHVPPIDQLAVVLPPAPGPIAAPAPPASAATSRKEEEEHQSQTEGQEGDEAKFTAISYSARQQRAHEAMLNWILVATAATMGVGLATIAAMVRSRTNKKYCKVRIE